MNSWDKVKLLTNFFHLKQQWIMCSFAIKVTDIDTMTENIPANKYEYVRRFLLPEVLYTLCGTGVLTSIDFLYKIYSKPITK